MNGLKEGPGALKLLIDLLGEAVVDVPTGPDRFTPREVVAHLADWEPIFRSRIVRTIEEERPTIAVYDEGSRAAELGYSTWDVGRTLVSFQCERAATVGVLENLEPKDWQRVFIHPENGEMTLAQQAGMLVGHDAYHIRQLIEVMSEQG